jgi:hypothetical protein
MVGKGTKPRWASAFYYEALAYRGAQCLIWPFSRDNHGYAQIKPPKSIPRKVHRLLCEAVHGKPPSRRHIAAHHCGNGHLGCVNPLHVRWATRQEDRDDMVRHGRSTRGVLATGAILKNADVRRIRRLYATGKYIYREIAEKFGVDTETVGDIIRGQTWTWLK